MQVKEAVCQRALVPLNRIAVDFRELHLISLDTTVEGSAAGRVAEHLLWLHDALSAKGPAASVLFLHHHVFEYGIAPIDRIMCG